MALISMFYSGIKYYITDTALQPFSTGVERILSRHDITTEYNHYLTL